MDILVACDLTKVYKDGNGERKALDGVNLRVGKGEYLAIAGASGSGKSTLIHLLAGVDTPTSGKIFLGDTEVTRLSGDSLALYRRRQVGVVYRSSNLLSPLTAKENILLPLVMDKKKPEREYYDLLARTMELKGREGHLPSQMSEEERQRVALARRLVARPDIVLADEPAGKLDSKGSRRIMDLLLRRNRELGRTVILATHDISLTSGADRVLVMKDGRLSGEGSLK